MWHAVETDPLLWSLILMPYVFTTAWTLNRQSSNKWDFFLKGILKERGQMLIDFLPLCSELPGHRN